MKIKFPIILALLCFFTYFNALSCGFVSDDTSLLRDEQKIAHFGSILRDFPTFIYTLTYKFWGLNTIAHHAVSVVFHIVAVLLTFVFLKTLFQEIPAFLASVLFAVLPVHVENVTWISGRHYIYIHILLVFCLLFYQDYIVNKRASSLIKTIALLLLGALGLSQWVFAVPLILVAFDLFYNKRKSPLNYIIMTCLLGFVYLINASAVTSRIDNYIKQTPDMAVFSTNPAIVFCYSIIENLKLVIFPANLTLYHEPAMIDIHALFMEGVLIFLLLAFWKNILTFSKELFFGIAVFIIYLFPTYMPKPICWMVDERYLYTPSLVFCIFIAVLYRKYAAKLGEFFLWSFLLMALAYSFVTVIRNQDYRNANTFWEATAKSSPLSPRAHNNFGETYLRDGNYEKAEAEFKKAIDLNPKYSFAWHNLGAVYHVTGEHKKAEIAYKKALELRPGQDETKEMLKIIAVKETEL